MYAISQIIKILLFDDLLFIRTAILMHKINNSAICSAVHAIFVRCSNIHSHYARSSDLNFYLNHATNKISKCFIAFHGALVWISLSVSIKKLSSLPKFKFTIINNVGRRIKIFLRLKADGKIDVINTSVASFAKVLCVNKS